MLGKGSVILLWHSMGLPSWLRHFIVALHGPSLIAPSFYCGTPWAFPHGSVILLWHSMGLPSFYDFHTGKTKSRGQFHVAVNVVGT